MPRTSLTLVSLLVSVFVVACGGGAAPAAETQTTPAPSATAENWQTVAPEGEGFSIDIPYAVQRQESDVGNGVMQHQFVAESPDQDIAFIVAVVHRGSVATAEESTQMLQAAYEATSQMDGAHAEAPQAITLNGVSGVGFVMEGTAEGQRMVFINKMFAHGDKFIHFMAIIDATRHQEVPASVARYMDSAQLR